MDAGNIDINQLETGVSLSFHALLYSDKRSTAVLFILTTVSFYFNSW